jgi:hypothetical protein
MSNAPRRLIELHQRTTGLSPGEAARRASEDWRSEKKSKSGRARKRRNANSKTLHFESFPAYKRWLAAGHIHHLFRHHGGKGTPTIKIQGKFYKPQHGNPAELVIFGNPGDRWTVVKITRTGREIPFQGVWQSRSGAEAAMAHAQKAQPRDRFEVREVAAANRGRRAGRSNPHKAGCQCALCKNARGEKHAAGCKCAICNRGATHGNPRRRNQGESGEEMTQAVQLYEAFQGKDADKVIERTISDEMRHNYVALGKLVAVGTGECNVSAERLVSQYDHQPRIDFEGDGVILACSPDGAQLYFIGGRQRLDTGGLNRLAEDPSKDFFDLGECGWVVYAAQKAPDFESVKYVHKFGEESKTAEVPRLIYDGIREQFFLAGGEYHVDAPGIIN